jgi:DNA-binding NarL/FixJ family response regulator
LTDLLSHRVDDVTPHLTPRQRDIVSAIKKGYSNEHIARLLGLRVQSVKNQLSLIYQKLGVTSRLELTTYLTQSGGDEQQRT